MGVRQAVKPDPNKNRRVALVAAGIAAGMLGMAYASVPLYRLFCQTTGFGGTPQIAVAAPETTTTQSITIRFDSNTESGLPWNFHPREATQTIKIGDVAMAYFEAHNLSNKTTTGTAMFNVTPASAGIFFNKIQCFCFTKQTLKPGEAISMPVQYFVDPAILDDADTKGIDEITLSYTFYPVAADTSAAALATN